MSDKFLKFFNNRMSDYESDHILPGRGAQDLKHARNILHPRLHKTDKSFSDINKIK